jgi:hypothetical protein
MATKLLRKYGQEEAREHKVSQKMGERLASDHIRVFGNSYYKEAEKMEKRLLARKNRKRKRT